jgi:hypothetical protein
MSACSTQCSVQASGRVDEADAMVRAGTPVLQVAKRLGISHQALGRHVRNGHVVPGPRTATSAGSPSSGFSAPTAAGGQVDPIADLTAQRDLLAAIDVSALSPTAQMSLFVERRRTSEALARLLPPPPPPPSGAMEKFVGLAFEVLDEYPDAWARLFAGWREYRGLGPEPTVEEIDAARARLNTKKFTPKEVA